MRIIKSVSQMQKLASRYKRTGKMIGLVPTMGYLHDGHLSLIKRAGKDCDITVVSIFVNPTQFGPKEDLKRYPRDLKRDIALLKKHGVDILFHPSAKAMYPEGYGAYLYVNKLSDLMCGRSRPGHFRGVATVVAKLFNIIKPDSAYFGKKDYQQFVLIGRMAKDLNMDVKVIGMPIIRERDGLAMSSRNKYLNAEQRKKSVIIYKALNAAKAMIRSGARSASAIRRKLVKMIRSVKGVKIDYVSIVDRTTLEEKKSLSGGGLIAVAAFVGKTRLIDNIEIGGKE